MRTYYLLRAILAIGAVAVVVSAADADVVRDYSADGGGNNTELLNGLAARATFSVMGEKLSILLENTSTGTPASFESSDSLLVSLGMNLPGVSIASGDAAVIGPGSVGIGAWSSRGAGYNVGDEWLWTNDSGGDLMSTYAQVISTSAGQGGGVVTRFDGLSGTVNGPFGGIAASPLTRPIPGSKPAVSDSIRFELTLTGILTEAQLQAVAESSIVEFGSDQRYLTVPEPSTASLLMLSCVCLIRRRRTLRAHK
jgi:hypothetical protein